MRRREELYLADIVEACRDVVRFVDGVSLDEWIANEIVHYAVLQRLTVVGEAAQRLDAAVRDRYPQVPWPALVAFRNLAVHEYFAVDWARSSGRSPRTTFRGCSPRSSVS